MVKRNPNIRNKKIKSLVTDNWFICEIRRAKLNCNEESVLAYTGKSNKSRDCEGHDKG